MTYLLALLWLAGILICAFPPSRFVVWVAGRKLSAVDSIERFIAPRPLLWRFWNPTVITT
ncbi:hypothetical protein SEA_OCTOBIEN14_70 [Gordonia phage Octobien14]|uniref:Uncharacterized protein n=1 Tax=Gordonia phage Octobien14 TaxID=2483673 RepID=A0A3G3M9S8_9CAUD|nr:hypothetical protein L3Y22_gp070 [Gordonia phage Octobien14]AYR03216.1 hypothetical protein SEA_OCTOBIEN14_70 [Gordonia phage Octobien14]